MFKKADRKAFVEGVLSLLGDEIKSAASKVEETRERYEVWFHGEEKVWFLTDFGPLEIRGITASKELLSVFQAFRDDSKYMPARAFTIGRVNPYTGKWNFHLSGGSSIEPMLRIVKADYDSVGLGERINV